MRNKLPVLKKKDTLRHARRQTILLLGMVCVPIQAFAVTMSVDWYEQKGRLENASRVYILPPRLIVGNREALGYNLDEATPQYKQIVKAIYYSSSESFAKKGYQAILPTASKDAPQALITPDEADSIWTDVTKFTDEGKYKKRKILPYQMKEPLDKLKNVFGDADVAVFIQLFGSFKFEITEKEEVGGVVAGNLIANAILVPLTGTVVVGGTAGEYKQFDYKISVFDLKTGELIWYREGVKDSTDFRSWSKLMNSMVDIYDGELPKANNPVSTSKFKIKRSQLMERKPNQ